MSPDRQFTTVATAQVLNCPKRYSDYHTDLVNLLVKVVATQGEGLSDGRRRTEVLAIVETFGNLVVTKIKE
jgi:hypothetical protein